jgi:segregation and condensation protein B
MAVIEGLLFLTGDDGLTIEQAAETMNLKKMKSKLYWMNCRSTIQVMTAALKLNGSVRPIVSLSKAFVHESAKKAVPDQQRIQIEQCGNGNTGYHCL